MQSKEPIHRIFQAPIQLPKQPTDVIPGMQSRTKSDFVKIIEQYGQILKELTQGETELSESSEMILGNLGKIVEWKEVLLEGKPLSIFLKTLNKSKYQEFKNTYNTMCVHAFMMQFEEASGSLSEEMKQLSTKGLWRADKGNGILELWTEAEDLGITRGTLYEGKEYHGIKPGQPFYGENFLLENGTIYRNYQRFRYDEGKLYELRDGKETECRGGIFQTCASKFGWDHGVKKDGQGKTYLLIQDQAFPAEGRISDQIDYDRLFLHADLTKPEDPKSSKFTEAASKRREQTQAIKSVFNEIYPELFKSGLVKITQSEVRVSLPPVSRKDAPTEYRKPLSRLPQDPEALKTFLENDENLNNLNQLMKARAVPIYNNILNEIKNSNFIFISKHSSLSQDGNDLIVQFQKQDRTQESRSVSLHMPREQIQRELERINQEILKEHVVSHIRNMPEFEELKETAELSTSGDKLVIQFRTTKNETEVRELSIEQPLPSILKFAGRVQQEIFEDRVLLKIQRDPELAPLKQLMEKKLVEITRDDTKENLKIVLSLPDQPEQKSQISLSLPWPTIRKELISILDRSPVEETLVSRLESDSSLQAIREKQVTYTLQKERLKIELLAPGRAEGAHTYFFSIKQPYEKIRKRIQRIQDKLLKITELLKIIQEIPKESVRNEKTRLKKNVCIDYYTLDGSLVTKKISMKSSQAQILRKLKKFSEELEKTSLTSLISSLLHDDEDIEPYKYHISNDKKVEKGKLIIELTSNPGGKTREISLRQSKEKIKEEIKNAYEEILKSKIESIVLQKFSDFQVSVTADKIVLSKGEETHEIQLSLSWKEMSQQIKKIRST